MTELIVAAFETEAAAQEAQDELAAIGIEAAAVRRYAPGLDAGDAARPHVDENRRGGFWAWLTGEESGSETTADAALYERRATAGNAVLSVTVMDDAKIHQVVDILDAHHPLNIDERTEENEPGIQAAGRAQDVTPVRAPAATGEVLPTQASGTSAVPGLAPTPGRESETRVTPAAQNVPADGNEQVIPLAEEQLDVGTRVVDRGVTRVRRYVVEKPVERDLTLRGERVTVERRRPVDVDAAPDAAAFEERTVEVREKEEVPEVRKTTRVVEEVAIRREQTERHETVRDTVRRDEVDVTPEGRTATDRP